MLRQAANVHESILGRRVGEIKAVRKKERIKVYLEKLWFGSVVLGCLLFGFLTAGVAQEAGEEEEIVIEVTVEAEAIEPEAFEAPPGTSVTEVTAEEIEDTGAQTAVDVVEIDPTVEVRHQGRMDMESITIRGSTPIAILVDGQPVARGGGYAYLCPSGERFSGRALRTIPASAIEKIEVIRNSGTVIYGPSGASGSVVNIITKSPKGPQYSGIESHSGSYHRRFHRAHASAAEGPVSYLIDLQRASVTSNLEYGAESFTTLFSKVTARPSKDSLLRLNIQAVEGSQDVDVSTDPTIVRQMYWTIDPWRERYISSSYAKALGADSQFLLEGYHRHRRFGHLWYNEPEKLTTRGIMTLNDNEVGANAVWTLQLPGLSRVRTGLQYRRLSANDTREGQFPIVPVDTTIDMSSLFAHGEKDLSERTRVGFGLRYDDPSDRKSATGFSFGVEVQPNPRIRHFATLASGVEVPTFNQMQSDPTLATQKSLHLDVGTKRNLRSGARMGISAFGSQVTGAAIPYNHYFYYGEGPEWGPAAWREKNEDIKLWGLETAFDTPVGKHGTSFLNYAYFRATVTHDNEPYEVRLNYTPRHKVSAGWRYRNLEKGLKASLTGRYTSSYMAQSGAMVQPLPVESHAVFDGRIAFSSEGQETYMGIDNIFNTGYSTMPAFPRPGRTFYIGFSSPLIVEG